MLNGVALCSGSNCRFVHSPTPLCFIARLISASDTSSKLTARPPSGNASYRDKLEGKIRKNAISWPSFLRICTAVLNVTQCCICRWGRLDHSASTASCWRHQCDPGGWKAEQIGDGNGSADNQGHTIEGRWTSTSLRSGAQQRVP